MRFFVLFIIDCTGWLTRNLDAQVPILPSTAGTVHISDDQDATPAFRGASSVILNAVGQGAVRSGRSVVRVKKFLTLRRAAGVRGLHFLRQREENFS
jgi:hypothetical protein